MGRGLSDLEKFILKRVVELRGSLHKPETKPDFFCIESRDLFHLDRSHILYHKASISRSISRLEKRRLAVRPDRGQIGLTRKGIRLAKRLYSEDWEVRWAGLVHPHPRIEGGLRAVIGYRGDIGLKQTGSIEGRTNARDFLIKQFLPAELKDQSEKRRSSSILVVESGDNIARGLMVNSS